MRSVARAFSRIFLYDVTDHSSAPTFQRSASSACASVAATWDGPENNMAARVGLSGASAH